MARKLKEVDESLALVGSEVPLPEGAVSPEIHVLRYECNALVRKRSGKAPLGHTTLPFLGKNTRWMIM